MSPSLTEQVEHAIWAGWEFCDKMFGYQKVSADGNWNFLWDLISLDNICQERFLRCRWCSGLKTESKCRSAEQWSVNNLLCNFVRPKFQFSLFQTTNMNHSPPQPECLGTLLDIMGWVSLTALDPFTYWIKYSLDQRQNYNI